MSILARIGRFLDRREPAKTLAMIDQAELGIDRCPVRKGGQNIVRHLTERPPPPAPLRGPRLMPPWMPPAPPPSRRRG